MAGDENEVVDDTEGRDELDFDALMEAHDIADEESGHAAAVAAREQILILARTVFPPDGGTFAHIVILGFVARAQSLHDAVIASVQANNPQAAFTLLRAYAEQCAAILYMTDNPEKSKPLEGGEGYGPSIGVITNYAQNSKRMPNFREVYHRLSQYAHPSAAGHFASVQVGSDDSFSWQSAPRFKRDEDKLIAYGWCIDFARAINTFGFEFAEARGLGSFVPEEHVSAWPNGHAPWSSV